MNKKYVFILVFFYIIINLFSDDKQSELIRKYLDMLTNFNWDKIEKNNYKTGYNILDEVNLILDTINSNPDIFNKPINKNILELKKLSNGYIQIGKSKQVIINYDKIFLDKIRYLVYFDSVKNILMIFKNNVFLYFVDFSKNPAAHYKLKLNSLYFSNDDFVSGQYSLEKFLQAISDNLYTLSIVQRIEVEREYSTFDNSWKKYFINPNDNLLIFKPSIEFELKNEKGINFNFVNDFHNVQQSKLYPVWLKYTREFKAPHNSYEFLNELISIPNFYDVWYDRHKNWINNNRKIELSAKTIALIKSSKDAREKLLSDFDKHNRFNLAKEAFIKLNDINQNLSKEDKLNIIQMNRLLLEETFPYLCPKKLELKFIPESIVGDIDTYVDPSAANFLVKQNVTSRIIIERNKDVNEIDDNSIKTQDKDIYKYLKNENTKRRFAKTNLIIVSTHCKSNNIYKSDKYLTYDETYRNISKNSDYVDFGNISSNYYGNELKIRPYIKLKYYFNSLKKYFNDGISDGLIQTIYDKQFIILSKLSDYCNGKVLINNKYYKFSDYKELSWIFLKLQYEYLMRNKKINFEADNWDIPIMLINTGDNTFTDYFLNYEK